VHRITGAMALLLLAGFVHGARADLVSISGRISQSVQDGTGPAVNNPSLNNILDGDLWKATLAFDGSLTNPANTSLSFFHPASGAQETAFDFLSLTITEVGGLAEFSLFACLTTGSACAAGNQLTASFQIPGASLYFANVAAAGLDQPHPLDLLEDDGTTDIQGSITDYSYTTAPAPVPEPSTGALPGFALMLLAAGQLRRNEL